MLVILFLLMMLLGLAWLPGTIALLYWGKMHWLAALILSIAAIVIGEAFLLLACTFLSDRKARLSHFDLLK